MHADISADLGSNNGSGLQCGHLIGIARESHLRGHPCAFVGARVDEGARTAQARIGTFSAMPDGVVKIVPARSWPRAAQAWWRERSTHEVVKRLGARSQT